MVFIKVGDMLLEKEGDKLTFFFLNYKTKTFETRMISGDDVKKLASLLYGVTS
jgi:hypothetical protein